MALFTYKVDETGDLVLDASSRPTKLMYQKYVDQLVNNILSLWKGSYAHDLQRGIDWYEIVRYKNYDKDSILSFIKAGLFQCQYITNVIDVALNVDKQTRKASLYYFVTINKSNISGTVSL